MMRIGKIIFSLVVVGLFVIGLTSPSLAKNKFEKEVEKEDEAPAAAPAAAAPYVAPDDDAEQEGEKKVDDIDRLMDKYDHEEDAKKFKKTDKFKAG